MAQRDSLSEFLRRKHEEAESVDRADWSRRVGDWQKAIRGLYGDIETWLLDSINAHYVELRRDPLTINEERVGDYETEVLTISVGVERVVLQPKGTLIIGANGRVDIRGPNGDGMLVLDNEWKWNVARRDPRVTLFPLSKESFAELLRQVMKP